MAFNFKQGASATRVYVLLVALLVLSLALITIYAREGSSGVLHTAQNALSLVASPLRSASGALSAAEDASAATASDVVADESSLSALREQNAQLRQNLAELEEYRAEAQRLQELLDLKDDNKLDGTAARVLSRSSDAWNNVITIDKGTDAGIHEGLAVMASSGLIGQVISTTSLSSQVRLMQDPQFGVAAMVQSSRAEGIVKGALDGLLYLEDIDSDAQVALGDTVITSGLGGGFYRGILIGTVVKIDGQQGDANRRIVVEPNASASPLSEVFVVTGMSDTANTTNDTDTGTTARTTNTTNTTQDASSASRSATRN